MHWTIMLRCSDEAGNTQTAEVLTLERDVEPTFSRRGLLHREAKLLLLGVAVPFMRKVTVWKPFKFNELQLGRTPLSLNLNAFQVLPLTPSLFSA